MSAYKRLIVSYDFRYLDTTIGRRDESEIIHDIHLVRSSDFRASSLVILAPLFSLAMIPNMASPRATELEGHDDLLKDHEVVVMPNSALGGMSVRDLLSSQDDDQPQHQPRRSRSAGRTVSRSRDIVQDVYDRMGVSYSRGQPLDLLVDGGAVASGIEARNPAPARGRQASRHEADGASGRGRSEQVDPERERRARSLSRGRMQQRWQTAVTTKDPSPISQRSSLAGSGSAPLTPVPAPKPTATATTPVRQVPTTPVRQAPTTPVRPAAATPVRQTPTSNNIRTTIPPFKDSLRSPPPSQPNLAIHRSVSHDYASNIERREYAGSERRDLPGSDLKHISTPDLKDEKKEDGSAMSEESKAAQRRLSIKDRISAYRGKETPTRTGGTPSRPRRSFSTFSSPQYMSKRELPPQVDIYRTESDAMTDMTCETGMGNTAPFDATRAAVEAAPDPPVDKYRRISAANSVPAAGVRSARTTGRIADVFLSAISPVPVKAALSPRAYRSVPKSIPVVEINGNRSDETGAADAQSLAASSVSGDDYLNSPKHASRSVVVGLPMKKNSLKPDIHKYGSTRNSMTGMTISSQINSTTPIVTPEMEKIIEDRVQAQLSDMENRFQARLARMETLMENQHKEHVHALEAKLDQLHSLLTNIAAAGSAAAESESSSRSVAKKGPGDKKLLMLLSNQSGNRQQVADQDRAQTLFKVRKIDTQLLDGSDPTNKPRRDELFGISGIRANYPQFFLVGDTSTTFLGNFDVIESMNDVGTLTNDILGTS